MTALTQAPVRLPSGAGSWSRLPRVTRRAVWPLCGLAILVGVWELFGRLGVVGPSLPPLSRVVATLADQDLRPVFWRALGATVQRAGRGYVLGAGLALLVAVVVLVVPRLHEGVYRLAVVISSIPFIALAPFFMATMPREQGPVVAALLAVFLSTLVTSVAGLNAAGALEHDVLSVLGAGRLQRIRLLQLPASIPVVLDGLRLAVPAAMLGAMIAEWFGSDRGLGILMLSSMQNYRIDVLWASALLSASVSMLFYGVLALVGRIAAGRYPRPAQLYRPVISASGSRFRSVVNATAPFWSVVLLLVLWQWWVWSADVPNLVLPPASSVLGDIASSPMSYVGSAAYTALVSLLGLGLGMLLGAGVALLMSRFTIVRALSTPAAVTFQSVPIVVVIPLVARLVGYSDRTVVVVALLMSFFPSFVLIESGLRAVPPGSDDLLSVLGSSPSRRLRLLRLPAAVPNALVALRISSAACVLGALTAEWLIGQRGLGRLFAESRARLGVERSWGAIVVSTALGVTAFLLSGIIERRGRERWS